MPSGGLYTVPDLEMPTAGGFRVILGVLCAALVAIWAFPPAVAAPESADRTLIRKLNAKRQERGLPRLRRSPSLSRSSARYARWMMAHRYFGHLGRIRASRRFRVRGELLGRHRGWHPRPRRVMRSWMRSPFHRRILLSRRFRHVGAGRSRGRPGRSRATFWVVQVGRR